MICAVIVVPIFAPKIIDVYKRQVLRSASQMDSHIAPIHCFLWQIQLAGTDKLPEVHLPHQTMMHNTHTDRLHPRYPCGWTGSLFLLWKYLHPHEYIHQKLSAEIPVLFLTLSGRVRPAVPLTMHHKYRSRCV